MAMRVIRVSLKYFTIGLLTGLMLAPRAGRETRERIVNEVTGALRQWTGGSASRSAPSSQSTAL
jgi:hypothetical protein